MFLALFCGDHSHIFVDLDIIKEKQSREGLWKFNRSLLSNEEFTCYMKSFISYFKLKIKQNLFDDQMELF